MILYSYSKRPLVKQAHIDSNKKIFSNTACFKTNKSSNNSSNNSSISRTPDLISSNNSETYNEESSKSSKFIKSDSGQLVRDISVADITHATEKIDMIDDKKKAQETYDDVHDKINIAYVVTKDRIIKEKDDEVNSLKEKLNFYGKYSKEERIIVEEEYEKGRKIIEEKYQEQQVENLNYSSSLKGDLRANIGRDDLILRGLDETNEESVENFEEELERYKNNPSSNNPSSNDSSSNNSSSNNSSSNDSSDKGSLYTHADPQKLPSDSFDNYGEGSSKTNDLGKKRYLDDSSQEENLSKQETSSKQEPDAKRIKQDSSDIMPDCEPFDPFCDE